MFEQKKNIDFEDILCVGTLFSFGPLKFKEGKIWPFEMGKCIVENINGLFFLILFNFLLYP